MQNDYLTLWNRCLSIIKDIVPESAFDTWFRPIRPLSYEQHRLTIQVPTQFFYEYLDEKFVDVLQATLRRVFGEGTLLNYSIKVDNSTGDANE